MDIDIERHRSYEFFVIRNFLLTKNFTFNQIVKKTKGQKLIFIISHYFKINPQFISDYIKDKKGNINLIDYHPNIVTVSDVLPTPPLENGQYLSLSPDMSETEVKKIYRLHKKTFNSPYFQSTKRQERLSTKNLKTYIDCEKAIIKTYKDRSIKPKHFATKIMNDATAKVAISWVDSNKTSLSEITARERIRDVHNKVCKNYSLPKISSLAKILKIIDS
jgi:hypothetical protein